MSHREFDTNSTDHSKVSTKVVGQTADPKTENDTARATQLTRDQQGLLKLQRDYGNRHVQRLLKLDRKGEANADVSPAIEQTIHRKRGRGQNLEKGVKSQMTSAFGNNIKRVRIHTDSEADQLNRQLNAKAFTTGHDIFFRQGAYEPGSTSGRELIAHELTHVVQQTGRVQRKMALGKQGDAQEQEADEMARAVMRQEHQGARTASSQNMVHRQTEEEEETLATKRESGMVQRQAEEEDEQIAMKPHGVQRQVEEEEETLATKRGSSIVQRQTEEDDEAISMKLLGVQRQTEEEDETIATKRVSGMIQRQAEEGDETIAMKPLGVQRQQNTEDEETVIAAKAEPGGLQRQSDSESSASNKENTSEPAQGWEILMSMIKPGSASENAVKQRFNIAWIDSLDQRLRDQIDGAYSEAAEKKILDKLLKKEYKSFKKVIAPTFKHIKKRKERRSAIESAVRAHLEMIKPGLITDLETERVQSRGIEESLFAEMPKTGVTRSVGRLVARIDFLAAMTSVLGSQAKVKAHFIGIRQASVPGGVYLTAAGAERLGRAYTRFRTHYPRLDFPKSYVGQALRSRHQQRHRSGMLGHPLGFSVDYLAYENPHLKDEKVRLLLETVGGGPSRMILKSSGGKELGYSERRKIIKQLGRDEAGEQGEQLLAQVDAAYQAMVNTSEKFKSSLTPQNIVELQMLGEQHYWGHRNDIRKLTRQLATADKQLLKVRRIAMQSIRKQRQKQYREAVKQAQIDAREELTVSRQKGDPRVTTKAINAHPKVRAILEARDAITEQDVEGHPRVVKALEKREMLQMQLDALTGPITIGLNKLMLPLIKKIDATIKEIVPGLQGYANENLPSRKHLYRLRRRLENINLKRKRAEWELRNILGKAANKNIFGQISGETYEDVAQLKQAMLAQLDRVGVAIQIRRLEDLKQRLLTDFDFVLGARAKQVVSNPPVLQLLKTGFARSDAVTEEATQPLPEGDKAVRVFNSLFIQNLIDHGFSPGAAWTTADTMHFDFVEGFDAIQGMGGSFGPEGYQPRE